MSAYVGSSKNLKDLKDLNAGVPAFPGSWGAADTPALVGNLLRAPTGRVGGAETVQRHGRRCVPLSCSWLSAFHAGGSRSSVASERSQRPASHRRGWSLLSSMGVNTVLPPPE